MNFSVYGANENSEIIASPDADCKITLNLDLANSVLGTNQLLVHLNNDLAYEILSGNLFSGSTEYIKNVSQGSRVVLNFYIEYIISGQAMDVYIDGVHKATLAERESFDYVIPTNTANVNVNILLRTVY